MAHPPPAALLRLAIVNDYSIVIAGMQSALRANGVEFVLVNEAELHTADVVLLDPFANHHSWDDVTRLLAAGARVVVFGWEPPDGRYLDNIDAGLLGFISKSSTAVEFAAAVRAVASGETLHPVTIGVDQAVSSWPGKDAGLTAREAEVLAFIAQGLDNNEIAKASFLSINTIKSHVRTAYGKTGVTSRTQAVLWALDHGLGNRAKIGRIRDTPDDYR
jgi:DNA-binding NarL/FixJ family response regulator